MRNRAYDINFYVSTKLEDEAREKAYSIGLVRGGKGIVAQLIYMFILNDLKNKPKYSFEEIDYGDRKRIKVRFPLELMTDVKDRAASLGFVRNGEGNVSEYINFILYKNLC